MKISSNIVDRIVSIISIAIIIFGISNYVIQQSEQDLKLKETKIEYADSHNMPLEDLTFLLKDD